MKINFKSSKILHLTLDNLRAVSPKGNYFSKYQKIRG